MSLVATQEFSCTRDLLCHLVKWFVMGTFAVILNGSFWLFLVFLVVFGCFYVFLVVFGCFYVFLDLVGGGFSE